MQLKFCFARSRVKIRGFNGYIYKALEYMPNPGVFPLAPAIDSFTIQIEVLSSAIHSVDILDWALRAITPTNVLDVELSLYRHCDATPNTSPSSIRQIEIDS